jgi:Na+-transporting NADH:ubiquinone oxidoreductase subunit NqrB
MHHTSMKKLLATYLAILALGIASYVTDIHYFANIAGFIGAMGLMLVFFKDRPEEEIDPQAYAQDKKMRRYWYIVFFTGLFFSLLFGSLWNDQMGGMK